MKEFIIALVCVILFCNIADVILTNRKIRKLMLQNSTDKEAITVLIDKYNGMNVFSKRFIHVAEIENLIANVRSLKEKKHSTGDEFIVDIGTEKLKGKYTGELSSETPDGKGTIVCTTSSGIVIKYEGEFDSGRITGEGKMTYSTGETLEGKFVNGYLDGSGVEYNRFGKVIKRGHFTVGKLNGVGTIYDQDGKEIFYGDFANGKPSETEYKKRCVNATYASLSANIDQFKNRNVCIGSIISDVSVTEDMTVQYIISIVGNKNVIIDYMGDGQSIRKGDNVIFYGYCVGTKTVLDSSGNLRDGIVIKAYYAEPK